MFTERKMSTVFWLYCWELTLWAGDLVKTGATSDAEKKGEKASYMFTGHTAFLLFCKEKLFIEGLIF